MASKGGGWRNSRWWSSFHHRIRRLTDPIWRFWKQFGPVRPAALVLCVLVLVLSLLWRGYHGFGNIEQGIYIEAWGAVFDILIVGVILTLFAMGQNRAERIERYLEEISDFKKWDSEEAQFRIAGNIRRLATLGNTDIDFSGIVLRDFSFPGQDINSLKGATFSRGLNFTLSKNSTRLENVDFTNLDCSEVVFSMNTGKFAGLGLIGKNLGFFGTKLNGACFDGAKLSWTDYEAEEADWYVDHGEYEDGTPITKQEYFPAFADANLKGCSFRYVEFDHADFRDANNILEADFSGAKGLESCFFDDDVRKQILSASAN